MWRNTFWMGVVVSGLATGALAQTGAHRVDNQMLNACFDGGCHSGYGCSGPDYGCYQPGCDCYGSGGDCYASSCGAGQVGFGLCEPGCGMCEPGCDPNCYGSLFFDFDATFFKYHQSGGVKSVDAGGLAGGGNNAEFSYDFAPRFSGGYQSANGMGVRANYWTFDDSADTEDGSGFVEIEAQTLDIEFFKVVPVGCSSTAEVMAGFRAAKFEQRDDTDLDWEVDGIGLTLGLELSHCLRRNHRLYARARGSIVQGDTELHDGGSLDDTNGDGLDTTIGQMEIATGWEGRTRFCKGTLVYSAGIEIHQWFDAAVAADNSSEAYLVDPSWGGFTASIGYDF